MASSGCWLRTVTCLLGPESVDGVFVDTHAHLCFPQFDEDRLPTIERALDAGVTRIVDVGTNLERSLQAIDLARDIEAVHATVGVHPHDVVDASEDIAAFEALLSAPEVVAVGETGLDFFRDYAPHDLQERLFKAHIRMALDHDLPLVIHSRGAEARVMDILEKEGNGTVRAVLHCFGGSMAEATEACARGYFLGFGGTITFKKSDRLDVALSIPEDRIILETDCPYLAPVPHRGGRNEPAYVRDVAEVLAGARGQSLATLARVTTENALTLLGLAA